MVARRALPRFLARRAPTAQGCGRLSRSACPGRRE